MTAPALLLVGHGTRDETGVEAVRSLVADLDERQPDISVASGFIERSTPSLADAVTELVDRGVRNGVVIPLVLSSGHDHSTILSAVAREQQGHHGISFAFGRPLSAHPALLTRLAGRLDAVLGSRAVPAGYRTGSRTSTTVLLVGRGSTDPEINAEVYKVARLLWEGRGVTSVETAFLSTAAPDVPAGLDRCRSLGATRVVVLPYFLFAGPLPERVVHQAQGWADAHPDIEVSCADVLGATDALAELVMEGYTEAVRGDAPTPCGTCVHRVATTATTEAVDAAAQAAHQAAVDPSADRQRNRHAHPH